MSNKRKNLWTVWRWLTAGLTVACGICLIAGCLTIYRSGERPFSPESVAAQFGRIAWLLWLTAGVITTGFLMELLFPAGKCRVKAIREEADILAALQRKAGTVTDEALAGQLKKLQQRGRLIRVFLWCVMAIGLALPLHFFLEPFRFAIENLNGDMRQFALRFAICCVILLVCLAASIYVTKAELRKQISLFKSAIAEGKCDGIFPSAPAKKDTKKAVCYTRIAVAAVAVVFIVLGVMNEGILDVLGKAIAICTECIGLG